MQQRGPTYGEEPLSAMQKEFRRGQKMLLHATITHSVNDYLLYNRGTILPVVDALSKRDDLAQKHGITLYWTVSGAPEHVSSPPRK
jgi:hypothetical protein